jgi:hypothetical protein
MLDKLANRPDPLLAVVDDNTLAYTKAFAQSLGGKYVGENRLHG